MELFNIRFVREVEKHPVLYDYTLQEYSRKDFTAKAWNEVAKEVNLSVTDCKEKWRNLRSTFVKNLKSKPRGRGAIKKKPYYLMDAMKFAIPFIKGADVPTGNSPSIIQPSPTLYVSEMENVKEYSENTSSELEDNTVDQKQPPSSPSSRQATRTATPPESSPAMMSAPYSAIHQDDVTPSPDTVGTRRLVMERKCQSDADKAFAEYFSAKAAKMSNTNTEKDKREASIHSFLVSLVPDLMQMSDVQLRCFKRKTLLLIDEVTGTSSEILNHP